MVTAAALAACTRETRPRPNTARRTQPPPAEMTAYRMAMHLHSSGSEGPGSVRSHLAEAAANGFDVAWFSEHDWVRDGTFRRKEYHFLPEDQAVGGIWLLPAMPPVGTLRADSGGELIAGPTSPNDRAPAKGSLRLRATSSGRTKARVGHRIDTESRSMVNVRGRILGRSVLVDVLPTMGGPDAWGEIFFELSHHPGSSNRPPGIISLLYRLRPDVRRRTVSRHGTTAVVDVPVTLGTWQTVACHLTADVQEAWSDLDARDNSLQYIAFHASSRHQATTELLFGFLRFEESRYDALGVEQDLLDAYADLEPDVLGLIGTELSVGPHMNQYGGAQVPYPYGRVDSLAFRAGEIRRPIVDFIHGRGGLASINHPFLSADPFMGGTPQDVAGYLLSIGAAGADVLEVGYGSRDYLAGHLAVWDALTRNGLFITANGVSDDHSGQDWARQEGRFYTGAWAAGLTERNLLDALGSGRAYVGYLGSFGGTIDMTLDSVVPMGAVSVGQQSSRSLRIDVTDLPDGSAVEVLRGVVDHAGIADPTPNVAVVATLGARDLSASSELTIDTQDDCFVRLQVVDPTGAVVAFGQPIWALKAAPPPGVPAARQATAERDAG
jgi:hypothetical protein